jgi:hypothetical protein
MQQQLSHEGIYFVFLKKKSRLAPLVIISAFTYKSGIRQENGFPSWLYGSKYSNVLLGITKMVGNFVAVGFKVAVCTPLSIMPNNRTSMDLCIHHIYSKEL